MSLWVVIFIIAFLFSIPYDMQKSREEAEKEDRIRKMIRDEVRANRV